MASITANVTEHMSKVWLELILAGICAVVYLAFSKKPAAKRSKNIVYSCDDSCSNEEQSNVPDHELTASQLALKAMRQGRMQEAIALIQRSPDCIRRLPNDLAARLLITVAKLPKSATSAEELKVLTGKISSQALNTAVVDAMEANDVEACR